MNCSAAGSKQAVKTTLSLAGEFRLGGIRACFENGWRRRPACPGRRPADRNCSEQCREKTVPIGSNSRPGSVRRVAGRNRRVACATTKPFFKDAPRHEPVATRQSRRFESRVSLVTWPAPVSQPSTRNSCSGQILLLQRISNELEQRLRRRIIRQAEVVVELGVVGFLGSEDLRGNAGVL